WRRGGVACFLSCTATRSTQPIASIFRASNSCRSPGRSGFEWRLQQARDPSLTSLSRAANIINTLVCQQICRTDIAKCPTRRHHGAEGADLEGHYLITVPELAAEALGSYLGEHLSRRFASTHADLTELIPSIARTSLECI